MRKELITRFKLASGYRLVYKAGCLSAWCPPTPTPVLIKHQGVVGQLVGHSRNSCRQPIKVAGLKSCRLLFLLTAHAVKLKSSAIY